MMELFSEIYSAYFSAVRKLLEASQDKKLSEAETAEIISKAAFADSAFFIMPYLRSGEWKLPSGLEQGKFKLPITNLQKAWLKALLTDKRMKLFLDGGELIALNELLGDTEPLFDSGDFHYFDSALDGDPYESESYIHNFRLILSAVKNRRPLRIEYDSGKGRQSANDYLPIKLVYSRRDDKFRLKAVLKRKNRRKNVTLNLSRITRVSESGKTIEPLECPEVKNPSVVLRVSNERNAVERLMVQFAWAEKETEYDPETGVCTCRIFYEAGDETNLLIQLLSFGPVVEVLEPENFLAQIRERVKKQVALNEEGGFHF